jgi:hypothetical protein
MAMLRALAPQASPPEKATVTPTLLVSGVMRRCANLPSEKHWLSVACTAQVGDNAEQWCPATSTSMLAHTLNKYVHA